MKTVTMDEYVLRLYDDYNSNHLCIKDMAITHSIPVDLLEVLVEKGRVLYKNNTRFEGDVRICYNRDYE